MSEAIVDRYVASVHPWDEGQVEHFRLWLEDTGHVVVSREDVAAVLTVYEEHVAPENRGPWWNALAVAIGVVPCPHHNLVEGPHHATECHYYAEEHE